MPAYSALYPQFVPYTYEFQISGNYLFVGGDYNAPLNAYGVAIYDISNPTTPVYKTAFSVNNYNYPSDNNTDCSPHNVEGMQLVGNKLYTIGESGPDHFAMQG